MARQPGVLSLAANLETQYAGPLDARQIVETKADLINAATFEANDGTAYLYAGLFTLVYADPDSANNGFYWLRALPATEEANWILVSGGGSAADYAALANKPMINGVVLEGDKTSAELGLGTIRFEVVDVLPDIADAEKNIIYLLPNATDPTTKDEWIVIDDPESVEVPPALKFEKIGSIGGDLADYVLKTDITFTETAGTAVTVGGLAAGTVITGQDVYDVLSTILFPELFPTLSNPRVTFTSTSPNLVESNSVATINFTATFNPGSISPQYTATSPNRAGAPNLYTFTGTGLPATTASTNPAVTETITDHAFTTLGNSSWTVKVAYDEGVQPKSSKGNDFDTPLAAGETQVATVTIATVNPLFATTAAIADLTKQALIGPTVTYYEVDMAGETETEKQRLRYGRERGAITRVTQLNTLSGKHEDIALNTFSMTDLNVNINGVDQPYTEVAHIGGQIGARQLRFYF